MANYNMHIYLVSELEESFIYFGGLHSLEGVSCITQLWKASL